MVSVIKTPWIERERIDLSIVKAVFLIFAVLLLFYVSKISGVFVSPQWEHVDAVTVDNTVESMTYTVVFDKYKPENCEDGIYVSDGDNKIPFEITNYFYANDVCYNATIKFNNIIYGNVTAPEQQEINPEENGTTQQKEIEKEKMSSEAYEKTERSSITGQTSAITGEASSEDVTGSFQAEEFKTYYIFYGAVKGEPTPPFGTEKEIPREGAEVPEKGAPEIIVLPEIPANLTNETNITIPEGCIAVTICENQTVCDASKVGEGETYKIQTVCRNETVCRQEIFCNQTNLTSAGQNITGDGFTGQFSGKLDAEKTVNISFSEGVHFGFGISEINKQKPKDANLTFEEGEMRYDNIFDNLSLEYHPYTNSIKEIFVMYGKPNITEDFVISELISFGGIKEISLYEGATVVYKGKTETIGASSLFETQKDSPSFKKDSIGQIPSKVNVVDLEKNIEVIETGGDVDFSTEFGTVFYIPAGKVYDSNNASTDVLYKFTKQNDKIKLDIIVDSAWLLDEARVYPVYIDPSISTFQPRTPETGWINDQQLGYQRDTFPAFYNTAGDFVVTWINYSGADGVTNALKAKRFDSYSTVNETAEYDFTGCNEKRIPEVYDGIGSVNQVHISSTAASEAGGEILSVYTNGSSGTGTGNDVYMTWARPGDSSENINGENCTNGTAAYNLTPTMRMNEITTVNQHIAYAAASTDGERYGACWQSYLGTYPDWEIVFRLWDGTPTGYNFQNQQVVPTSNNNCGSWCSGNESSASSRVRTGTGASARDLTCMMDFQVNSTNNFVVCWAYYDGTAYYNGVCRCFNSTGNATGAEFAYESATGSVSPSDMVWLDNERFVVAYAQANISSGGAWVAKFSIYYANGTAIAAEQIVNNTVGLNHIYPSVARLENGNFIYVYQADFGGTNSYDILGAIYYKNGTLASSASHFVVNENRTNAQTMPRVESRNGTNEYVVVWQSQNDSNWDGVKMRLFGSIGPSISSVVINSSLGTNTTVENITSYAESTDPDNDYIFHTFNWKKNGRPIAVGLWPFDSNDDKYTRDYTDNGNNGSLGSGSVAYAPTWTEDGKIGGAYTFSSSTNNYITITDRDSMDTGQGLTISMWVKFSSVGSTYDTWFSRGPQGATGFIWFMLNGNNMYYQYSNGAAAVGNETTAQTWNLGQWYHIAVTSSNVTKRIVFYKDGEIVGNFTSAPIIVPVTTGDTYLGTYAGSPTASTYRFMGDMDDVRFYNQTLTPEQIKQIYSEGSEIGKWTFDRNEPSFNSSIRDISGYGNDGNVSGAVWNSTGQLGGAYNFDGSNDYIDVGNPTLLQFTTGTNSFSISAWFNKAADKSLNTVLMKQGTANSLGYGFSGNSTGGFSFALCKTNVGCDYASTALVSNNAWHHAVGVYNAATNGMTLYIDGVSVGTGTYTQGNIQSNDNFYIGNDKAAPTSRAFNGSVDNVQIYNYSIGADRVVQLYKEGLYGYSSTIVSQETSTGENWSATVTPNDLFLDGASVSTANMTIKQQTNISTCINLTYSNTYILTTNLSENQTTGRCIDIQADNVTLDCNGYYIKGSSKSGTIGIYATGRKNITITECGVQFYNVAFYFLNVNQSNILYNLVSNYTAGSSHLIQIVNSFYNNVSYNNISYSTYAGIYVANSGGAVSSGNSTIAYNKIEHCAANDWGGIALWRSDWNNVTGNNVSLNSQNGLYLDVADNNNITNNNFISNINGIRVGDDCQNNVLTNNNASSNTGWDFTNAQSGSVSIGNVITNLSIGNVTSSFTYSPNVGDGVGLKVATAPAGGDPAGYRSIGRFLNISGLYGTPWVYINITYQHSDLVGVGESSLRIWKNASSQWNQKLNLSGTLVSGVDTTNHYVYANISNFSSIYSPMELLDVTGCSNITVAGTYNLTADITGNQSGRPVCIDLQQGGTTLDCAGHSIIGIYPGITEAISSTGSTVKNCILKNYSSGIGGGGTFYNNSIYNMSLIGISCAWVSSGDGTCNSTLNTIVNATTGVFLGHDSIFMYNNVSQGNTGITMNNIEGSNSNVSHNRIFGNVWGVNASGTNQWIWDNNFTNTYNANDDSTGAKWNITKSPGPNIVGGKNISGNFWSDYTGADSDGDGIGDINLPYSVPGTAGAKDYGPLTQVSSCNISTTILLNSNLTCLNGMNVTSTGTLNSNDYNVTVTGGDTVINGTIHGRTGTMSFSSLRINVGGTYNATNGTTNITNGNLINRGTFTNNSGTVEFSNNSYIIGVNATYPFSKMTVDAGKNVTHMSEGFTASSDVTVNGILDSKQNALYCDGSNDYVNLSKINFTVQGNPQSVFMWIKTNQAGTGAGGVGIIFSKRVGSNTFAIAMNGGHIEINNWSLSTIGTLFVNDSNWHSVGFTYNSSNIVSIYIDGVLDTSGVLTLIAQTTTPTNSLCQFDGNGGRIYNGSVDDVRVYNRTLNSTEIYELYHNMYSNNTGLTGLWRFSEGTGSTTADESVYGNTGTLGNSTVGDSAEPAWVIPNITVGSLTINSGGTCSATNGTTKITSENPSGYVIKNAGTFTHNNGLINISTSDTLIDMGGTGAGKDFYNLEDASSAYIYMYSNIHVINNFNKTGAGNLISGNSQYRNLTVDGNATISAGRLGWYTTDPLFSQGYVTAGSLSILTNGRYDATNLVTNITDYISINGTYNYNGGSVNISGVNTKFASANNIKLQKVTSPPADTSIYKNISYYVNITNLTTTGGFGGNYFNITYAGTEPSEEGRLSMWKHNGTTWVQTGIVSTGVDTTNNWVWANISTFSSIFAPLEDLTEVANCKNLTQNNYYYFMGNSMTGTQADLDWCIYINSTNVTLDCNGYNLTNAGANNGIYVENAKNVTLRNCTVKSYNVGVYVTNSDYVNITNSTIYSCSYGAYLTAGSDYANLSNLNLSFNTYGAFIGEGSTASQNSTIYNNQIQHNGEGFVLNGGSYNKFVSNTFYSNDYDGIEIDTTSNSNFTSNTVYSNTVIGVLVTNAANNTFNNNNVSFNSESGFHVTGTSTNNTFTGNVVNQNTQYGFRISGGNNTSITNCNATGNGWDFYSYPFSIGDMNTTVTNLSMNNTKVSFTYREGIEVRSTTSPGADPHWYSNISKYLEIQTVTGFPWIYINVSYNATDIPSSILDNSTLRIWKYSGGWSQNLNDTGTLFSGVNTGARYIYANISNFSSVFAPLGETDIVPTTATPTIDPAAAYAHSNLYCNATLTDADDTSLTAYWTWYKNDVVNLSGTKSSITNGTNTNITVLLSGNLTAGESWKCKVTPYDGLENGTAVNSSAKYINSLCNITTPVTLLSNLNCVTLNVTSTGTLDSSTYNITATSGVVINGTLQGRIGKHSFGNLTINSGGTYNATNWTTNITNIISINGTYTYNGGSVNISGTNTKFATASNVKLQNVASPPADSSGFKNISYYVSITNLTATGGFGGTYFNITYTHADTSFESTLEMLNHNTATWTRTGVQSSGVDATNNYVWANISSFNGIFAPMEVNNSTSGCRDLPTQNLVYTLTGDLSGLQQNKSICIDIMANNTVLDCNYKTLTGTANGTGININNYTNITVKNCIIKNYTVGLRMLNTTNSNFTNLTFMQNMIYDFVEADSSTNNTASNVTFNKTSTNFTYYGEFYLTSTNDPGNRTADLNALDNFVNASGFAGINTGFGAGDGRSVMQTTDGGYIIGGTNSTGNSKLNLIKVDAYGVKQWSNKFGSPINGDGGWDAIQTADGGYLITGVTFDFNNFLIYYVKTNATGGLEWSKEFADTALSMYSYSVVQTTDGGYFFVGEDWNANAGMTYVFKTNGTGVWQWGNWFGNPSYVSSSYDGQQTVDGGYIVIGRLYNGVSSSNIDLIKLNSTGSDEWHQTFGGASDEDIGYSVQQTSDVGYIITGQKAGSTIWLIKTDVSGVEQWNKTFGSGIGYSVKQASDGGYVLSGIKGSDTILIKTDSNGNEQWNKTFGSGEIRSVIQTYDGGYTLAGTGGPGVWLIKTDSEGNITNTTGWLFLNESYNASKVAGSESAVSMYKYNSSWYKPGNFTSSNGVDTAGNYVWGNITNFSSTFAPLELLNIAPNITSLVLNSTLGTNLTTENLTAYVASSDAEGDNITHIYNWKINGKEIAVLIMPFDINSSTSAKDYTSNGNNGSITGATWTSSGKIGGAYNFDGNDYIDCGNTASLNITNKITISLWVKPTTNNQNAEIISKWTTGAGINNSYGINVGQDAANNKWLLSLEQSNTTVRSLISTKTFNAGQWYHVVMVANGTHILLYINGTDTNEAVTYDGTIMSTVKKLLIGKLREEDSIYSFNGAIDDVKIYNRSLSAGQVMQTYLDTKDGFSNNSTIHSDETTAGENWSVTVTPNDGKVDGTSNTSWNLTILTGNVAPTVSSMSVTPSPIDLTACGNITVNCSATVADTNGYTDMQTVNAVLFNSDLTNNACTANATKCYLNSSCTKTSCAGTSCTADCTFWDVRYYAKAGAWKCNITVNDSAGIKNSSEASVTVNNLTALEVGPSIDFGSVQPGDYSSNISHSIKNCGNYEIDVNQNGTNLYCNSGSIGVSNMSYSWTQASGYVALTTSPVLLNINISSALTDSPSSSNSWWRTYNTLGIAGNCTGNVTFIAVQSN